VRARGSLGCFWAEEERVDLGEVEQQSRGRFLKLVAARKGQGADRTKLPATGRAGTVFAVLGQSGAALKEGVRRAVWPHPDHQNRDVLFSSRTGREQAILRQYDQPATAILRLYSHNTVS
jgi:hypothetical protein